MGISLAKFEVLRVINGLLAIVLVALIYFVRLDSLLVFTLTVSASLCLLSLFPNMRHFLVVSFAILNAALMFFYFYRFFSVVPLLEHDWYIQLRYAPICVVLFAGFSSMYILAHNSCHLKREFEIPEEVGIKTWMSEFKARRGNAQSTVKASS